MEAAKAHKDLSLWRSIQKVLSAQGSAFLLLVTLHQGSSPGRSGFKMMVGKQGEMHGSIGGGIMEHKMVEWAKSQLKAGSRQIFLKRQIHQAEATSSRSGMICSGEQLVAGIPLGKDHSNLVSEMIRKLTDHSSGTLVATPHGLTLENTPCASNFEFHSSESGWRYRERIGFKSFLHIIGGGHVSLALSSLVTQLDFYLTVYDDRAHLHTMNQNIFAHEKKLVNYQDLSAEIPHGPQNYTVIMTFGYRSDLDVLSQLISKKFAYLGLLGSEAKIKTLFEQLTSQGISTSILNRVDAPAGINIHSQTTEEIAISIAAALIKCRHRMVN